MKIGFDDIITISFIERCDGEVLDTNIEEVARENGIYNEAHEYLPLVTSVGSDDFPDGLYDELVGKEVGAKGTIILPPEEAYGERRSEYIRSVNKKDFSKIPKIGEVISDPEDGDGIVVNKIGSQLIIDFNHRCAGKEVEYEYEVHEIITDPAEQFFRILDSPFEFEYDASFEDGTGIVSAIISTEYVASWNVKRVILAEDLFEKHPSLDFLEFHDEYHNIFHAMAVDSDDAELDVESEEIKVGDLITFNFIKRCDEIIVDTNIEQVARDNDVYDEDYEYEPDIVIIGLNTILNPLVSEFIGKKVGAKGTAIVPPEKAYGLRSKEKVHTIDRKELPKDAKVGSHIHHAEYGNGFIFDKIGKRFVADFNHPLAGKEIESDYEILERITDPAEQFYLLLARLGPRKYDASFENGKGTIHVNMPLLFIRQWNVKKIKIITELFQNLPFLHTLDFREEFMDRFPDGLFEYFEEGLLDFDELGLLDSADDET